MRVKNHSWLLSVCVALYAISQQRATAFVVPTAGTSTTRLCVQQRNPASYSACSHPEKYATAWRIQDSKRSGRSRNGEVFSTAISASMNPINSVTSIGEAAQQQGEVLVLREFSMPLLEASSPGAYARKVSGECEREFGETATVVRWHISAADEEKGEAQVEVRPGPLKPSHGCTKSGRFIRFYSVRV